MYEKELQQIEELAAKYGDKMQPPCSAAQLRRLQEESKRSLGVEVPDAYVRFLQQHDGFDWNGLAFFATERTPIAGYTDRFVNGCVEINLIRRRFPDWKRFFIFGTSGDDDYCLDLIGSRYAIVDAASIGVLETFPSFDDMVAEVLRRFM
jgi:hypothetical protein